MAWRLAEPADGVFVKADREGVAIKSDRVDLARADALAGLTSRSRLGRLLPTLIPQLLELGLLAQSSDGLRISYDAFVHLDSHGIDAFDGLVEWSPFTIELESSGAYGRDTFRYFYRFYYGPQVVHLQRIGCFVRRGDALYCLDAQAYALIEAIDAFHGLPPADKQSSKAFLRFRDIADLAEGVGAKLDEYLQREKVIVPARIGLDLIVEPSGRITFAPKIDGAPAEAMRTAFLASDDVDEVYSVPDRQGGRVRVVLDETQREVLRRMQRVRHLGGAERAEVLRDPHRVFDGVAGEIDLSDFGPRVRGIGDFPFVVQPYLQRSVTGVFDDPAIGAELGTTRKLNAGLRCTYADGTSEDVTLTSKDEVRALAQQAQAARQAGLGVLEFHGKQIVLDEQFLKAIQELVDRVTPSPGKAKPKHEGRYLLIYTNEGELEYDEDYTGEGGDADLELPHSLLDIELLMPHQREGVAWLQRNFKLGRHGCLLADDMGLGKTLQVLVFAAWLIEKQHVAPGSPDPGVAPWNPILIVTPVMLLENETWLNDMRQFFAGQGDIFQPCLVLHGATLKALRRPHAGGQETVIGEAVLDFSRLCQHRVILTNYETVTNYQHSFARMKKRWTAVITDEAQEYKTPNTKISHALKSMDPRFRVACTGTPVETRLLDVWNLFDFLQPGHLLGSAAEFSKAYENPIADETTEESLQSLTRLKTRLSYGRPDAFVLRREKTALNGLPPKHERTLDCTLSPRQREWHLELLSRARSGDQKDHPLAILAHLMRVYLHPALFPQYEPLDPHEALADCPKLAAVLECLQEIRLRREKALIFTRSLDMQQLLSGVIGAELGLNVEIVNGATRRGGDTHSATRTRKGIIDRFRHTEGFNVLILSPDVAGIGLTITEANHVIHYGRWWNPARESQATDRVYRIGQQRAVYVYYPITRDPQGTFETFDQKLDRLVRRRRALAAEFLAPMPSEEELGRELIGDILQGETPPEGGRPLNLTEHDVRKLPWDRFEALVAVLHRGQGARVILTPPSGDDGIDVIAVHGKLIHLIQCKHTQWDGRIDLDAVAEVTNAFDGYRAKWIPPLPSGFGLISALVTNGKVTAQAKAEARQRNIEIVSGADLIELMQAAPCNALDLEIIHAQRVPMSQLRDTVGQMIRSQVASKS